MGRDEIYGDKGYEDEAEGLVGTSRECLATSLDRWQCAPFITCMGKPDREP